MFARLLDWRRILVYTHRWLGILGNVLFLAWFVSGIVLMYAGMPTLSPGERLERLLAVDLSAARLSPTEAARRHGVSPDRLHIAMLGERPVYRFMERGLTTTVFADDGKRLERLTADEVMVVVASWAPEHAASLRYAARLREADQWTFGSQQFMPLHKVALGDPGDTYLYVSDRTGEPVMRTSRATRGVAYVGAVLHWLYFTPLRRHGEIWIQLVLWLSIVGCVMCLSGLVWGLWRWAPARRYRLKRYRSQTPYAGLMRWHHYTGLIFGLTTFTWTLSGALSLDPWDWHPPNSPSASQRAAVSGGQLRLGLMTLDGIQHAAGTISGDVGLKELEVVQFRGEPFLLASHVSPRDRVPESSGGPANPKQRLVSVVTPEKGVFTSFDREEVLAAARAAMPDVGVLDAAWLEDYDGYYYGRPGTRSLPVLRVRFDDPQKTWLYLDPGQGRIVLKEERLTRLNRWIYHGFHSLDFPFLYNRRPLWDLVVITLSLGGIALCVTSLWQAWKRLLRHGRRVSRFGR